MTNREYLREYWLNCVRVHNLPHIEKELQKQVDASLAYLSDSEVDEYVAGLKQRRGVK